MDNFFAALERFIKALEGTNPYGTFFEFDGAKIPYHIAEEIYLRVNAVVMWEKEIGENLEELNDYNRLLREENKRLRGSNENAE